MKKSVLRRVKVGTFCAHVRLAVDRLPEFLNEEKEEIIKLLDIMEGQTNAVRKNCYLEQLTKEYIPKLRNIIRIILLQLKDANPDDENANALRNFLTAHFKGRRTTEYTINWAEGVLTLEAPDDVYSAFTLEELKEHTQKLLEIRELYAKETARIASIGRTIDTRMKIIDLLFQALEVAKGFRHRRSTREAARDAIDTLEGMDAMMKRNMARGKRRKKKDGEDVALQITPYVASQVAQQVASQNTPHVASQNAPHVASLHTGLTKESPRCGGELWDKGVE